MSSHVQTIRVDQPSRRVRLDVFLHAQVPAVCRGAIQRLIESGDVQVDGRTVKSTHQPRVGEQIEIHWPPPKPCAAQPENIPLAILFEDESLLVLNKAPGFVVHPAAGHEEHTLVNALLHHCQGGLSGIGGVARPGIVHRLDKDTSGCMVVAKDDQTHLALATQFAQRAVVKTYDAIVCGVLAQPGGEIRAAIARHPNHRKRMAVADGGGRDAWTTYQVRQRLTGATLIRAQPHTGRTHQIRVHLQHIGYPVVGDDTYGRRLNGQLLELTGYAAPRQLLHASRLSFSHPVKGCLLQFQAPWPADFHDAVLALGGNPKLVPPAS